MKLKEVLQNKVPQWREDYKFLKSNADVVVDESTVGKIVTGMRGLKSLLCETSYLDPMEGIRFRGYTIPEVRKALPKPTEGDEPYPTGLWYLLLTGDIPTKEEVLDLEKEFVGRSAIPQYIIDILRSAPTDTHPMTLFTMAILALQRESQFAKRYSEGMRKEEYWEAAFEDSVTLLAKLPSIAAYIFRMRYRGDTHIAPDFDLDWGANFAHMLGDDDPVFKNLMRLYLLIHIDHESGNASAHTGHLVASTLSDPFYAIAGSMTALAGPLHGLANQECLKWILDLMDHFGGVPTKEQIKDYTWETLNSGRVVPGYGHAVLRQTDPRYAAQREFALKYLADDPVVKTVSNVYEVVPDVLKEHGKAKNPWPNVDAHSGSLLYHYGIREFQFYTVFFGVSRAMGITAEIIYDRAVGFPIERPKSLTVQMLKDIINKK